MEKDNEIWEPNDHVPICIVQNIKKSLQEVYDHYRSMEIRIKYLENENKRLKSDAYKDEELAKMKERCEKMKTDYYRCFSISEDEGKKIREWEDKIIGDTDLKINSSRFHYEFYLTGLGAAVGYVVDDFTGQQLCFHDIY